ncbi:Uma2 family endonuclease [Clostridium bowmanii]|uniref:Uma2 family endonuclease n=1 Tax=Clostridium bowmanii TaxID=132925 RepID=UPI001C0E243C|nr:Uma2 family endonuclease [Clostridium bowmanii]MBU3190627.1 Uma2 family endonuclease [Clostridium bowmanii]MCA1072523.1 Uma2 family endonuclease [Clostridium bowmanii]
MKSKISNNLYYVCSLIEFIGRETKNKRYDIVNLLGEEAIRHIFEYADVFHSEQIAAVADRCIEDYRIEKGFFDNVNDCKYNVPDYWSIGAVYQRLIENGNYTGVPTLIVEILSPSNESHDLVTKMNLYQHFGVNEYWIVNPKIKTV